MPDWQSELDVLLSQLHVSLDREDGGDVPHAREDHAEPAADDDPDASGSWSLGALATDEAPRDGDEVSAVRSEIAATVGQVVALVQAGRIEPAFRDDVIFVLQALIRPQPPVADWSARADDGEDTPVEWHLASAAAILRFCRIVLRLTHALSRPL